MSNLIINSIINKLGKKVYWLERIETVDENTGDIYFSFPNTIELKCIINSIGGILLPWLEYGLKIEADLQLFFKYNINTNKISINDRIVLLNEEEYEVSNVIKHPNPIDPEYIEVLIERL